MTGVVDTTKLKYASEKKMKPRSVSITMRYSNINTANKWFSIDKEIDDIEHNVMKKYFEITIPYGWKYFYFYHRSNSTDRKPRCYVCKKDGAILCLSCDAGRCNFPRFMPHTVSICNACMSEEKIPSTAPSCCFESGIMIKSANKQ